MKKKLLLGGSVGSFICSILLLIYFLYDFFNPHFMLNEIESIIFLCLSSLFFYLGNLALNKYQEKIKPLKMTLIYILFLYILLLMELTIFDFRRGFHLEFILTNKEALKSYMATSVRLTPLATTLNFIRLLLEARISVNIFMYNVLGNIVCLMPFAVILPLLFKKQNKPIVFILTIILISLGIELIQFITASGTLDIDDIIRTKYIWNS